MLSHISKEIGIEDFLFLSKGESKDTGKARQYILANAFEAVTGAIYIDRGWDYAKKFIEQYLLPELPIILEKKLYLDPKSLFQEKSQENVGVTPSYKVLEESGPDHAKIFTVGVYLNKELIATGEGSSKQEAEEHAARAGLETKNWLH